MDKFFIKEIVILNGQGLKTTFSIPMEFAKVKGLFMTYPTTNIEMRMEMKFNSKEVVNRLFDPNLIRFNGYLSRKDVMLELNEIGRNSTVDLMFTPKGGSQYPINANMYFLVE